MKIHVAVLMATPINFHLESKLSLLSRTIEYILYTLVSMTMCIFSIIPRKALCFYLYSHW